MEPLKIGITDVRGVVGESLTPQLFTSFAAAFGTYCGAGPILVGTDTRPSGEMVKQAAIAGLLSVGSIPVVAGSVPLPSLMLHVREAGAFGGIAVSGSHGSLEWNALRFISSEGLALRAHQAAELTDLYHQGLYPRVRALDMADVRADATSSARHVHGHRAGPLLRHRQPAAGLLRAGHQCRRRDRQLHRDHADRQRRWRQVVAVRLALVARSGQLEKEDVTHADPPWDVGSSVPVAGSASCGSSKCVTLKVSHLADWKRYR